MLYYNAPEIKIEIKKCWKIRKKHYSQLWRTWNCERYYSRLYETNIKDAEFNIIQKNTLHETLHINRNVINLTWVAL